MNWELVRGSRIKRLIRISILNGLSCVSGMVRVCGSSLIVIWLLFSGGIGIMLKIVRMVLMMSVFLRLLVIYLVVLVGMKGKV